MSWQRTRKRLLDQAVAWFAIIIILVFAATLLWVTATLLSAAVEYQGESTPSTTEAADWRPGGGFGGVKPE